MKFARFELLRCNFRVKELFTSHKHIPVIMGTHGRYLEIKRAVFPLVDNTIIAPAFCSKDAATAAMATVSAVSVGRGCMDLMLSNKGG